MSKELRALAAEWTDRGCDVDDLAFQGGSTSINKFMRSYLTGLLDAAPGLLDRLDRQERVMREALEYATFCWRDVPMNDYAVERTDALIAAIEKELGE